ncbi:MAG TPA: outer membrane beta-barrel protein, partial [Chitinophagales bacterium]
PSDSAYKAQVANVVDPVNGGGRFSSQLREHIFSANQNVKQKISVKDYHFEMNFGGYVEYKTRKFAARILGYTIKPGQTAYDLTQLPLAQMFDSENVGGANQFRIDEITNLSDAYTAQNLNIAPYVSFSLPIGKIVKIVAGVRYEYNKQSLQSYANLDSSSRITPNIVTNLVLPSMNTSFNINEKNLIRVAYGETVNRPEFREWAPFYFYDFEFNAGNYGSLYPTVFYPNGTVLKVAKIQNVDLRYEWYPSAGDMVHVGGFFKHFKDPIQQIINAAGGSDSKSFTYINGDHAYTAGAELDLRKNLGFMGGKVMKDFTLVCNAAYIYSKLYMPNLPTVNPTSALQGQAPYIVNTGLFYQNDKLGLRGSLLYNVTGPRIYILGNAYYPNIGDMPVHNLDLSLSYSILNNKLTFTFAALNLINTPNRLVLDIDRNGKFDTKHGLDKDFRSFQTGRVINLGVTFRI